MATVITEATQHTPAIGGLFAGLAFFLVQRIPQRANIVALIQSNGGRVVKVEAQADHVLADHLRNDAPSGSISWTFVEHALRDGSLPDAAHYSAGPVVGEVRSVGSVMPGKSTRTPFTAEEDRMLYKYVETAAADGESIKGNVLYKKYEALHPQHTYQSWRDRYLRRLQDSPPSGMYPGGFTHVELEELLCNARDVEKIAKDKEEAAWDAYAQAYPTHTAVQWANFYDDHVRPVYLTRRTELSKSERSKKRKRTSIETVEGVGKVDKDNTGDGVKSAKVRLAKEPTNETTDINTREDASGKAADNVAQARTEIVAGPSTEKRRTSEHADQHDIEAANFGDRSATPVAVDKEQSRDSLAISESANVSNATHDDIDAERFRREIMGPNHAIAISTSDLNQAADQQIRRESFSEDRDDRDAGDEQETPRTRPQLTEANLQSHRHEDDLPVARGVDLPEDDESQDQDHFVAYLSSFVKPSDQAQRTTEQEERNPTSDEVQHSPRERFEQHIQHPEDEQILERKMTQTSKLSKLPESDLGLIDEDLEGPVLSSDLGVDLRGYTNSQTLQYSDSDVLEQSEPPVLPMSSQQEVDDAVESAIYWPDSLDTFEAQKQISTMELIGDYLDHRHKTSRKRGHQAYVENDADGVADEAASDGVDLDLTVVEPDGGFEFTSPFKPTSPTAPPHHAVEADSDIETDEVTNHVPLSPDIIEASSTHQPSVDTAPKTYVDSNNGDGHAPNEDASLKAKSTGNAKALDTQDILNMETQVPDLEVPLPLDSDDDSSEGFFVSPLRRRPSEDLGQLAQSPSEQSRLGIWPHGLLSGHADNEEDTDHHIGIVRDTMDIPPPAPTPPQRDEPSLIETQRPRNLADTIRLVEGDDVDEYITTLNIRHGFTIDNIIDALKCTSMRPELTEIVLFDKRSGRGFPKDVPGIWSAEEDSEIESGVARRLREAEEKHGWIEIMARLEFLREWRE